MRLFGFVVLTIGGIYLLYLCAAPFWMAALAALALLVAGWILGIGLWPPLGRFELQLRSMDRAIQEKALRNLETMLETDYERPLAYLRGMLEHAAQDEDAGIREKAARILKRLEASEPLPEPAYEPVGPQVAEAPPGAAERATVAHILDRHTGLAAVGPLLELLQEGDPEVCRSAVDALVSIGSAALPALAEAHGDADPDVRVDVERAIHLIRGEPPLDT